MSIDLYWAASLGKWVTIPDDAEDAIVAAVSSEVAGAEASYFDGAIRTGVRRGLAVDKRFYGDWVIHYDPPPIPVRSCDWQFYHQDFDGAPDSGDRRCGSAASVADAMAQIDDHNTA